MTRLSNLFTINEQIEKREMAKLGVRAFSVSLLSSLQMRIRFLDIF
jgi:hypothetical protein